MEKLGVVPLFLCAILFFSCQKPPEMPVSGGPSRVTTVEAGQNDEVLSRIAEDARNTLPGFFRHLTRPDRGEGHFSIKYPFTADEDSGVDMEQLWLSAIYFKNGLYYGIIANTPQHLEGFKKGDKVIFDMDSITDWMYVRDGAIIGGDSIKYLLEQTPEYQRNESERELLGMFN